MTYTILLLLLSISDLVYSQILYTNSEKQLQTFTKENQAAALQASLEKCKVSLREKSLEKDGISNSYKDILKLCRSKKFPDDRTISDWCEKHPNLIIGNSENCHQYYNCSGEDYGLSGYISYSMWPSRNKHECYYPDLFSEETLQCENYTKVDCGKRYKPIWACRYFRLQCKFSHCQECKLRYPKCEDEADGFHASLDYFTGSRQFKICKNGRTVHVGYCSYDPIWSAPQFPYNGSCMHQYAIPKDKHLLGLLPSCKDVKDGSYQYEERPCTAYYRCDNGVATPVKCPPYTLFDKLSGTCKERIQC